MKNIIIILCLLIITGCNSAEKAEIKRDKDIIEALSKYVKSSYELEFKQPLKIDSIILTDVKEINDEISFQEQANEYFSYAKRRGYLDSLNMESIQIKFQRFKLLTSITNESDTYEAENIKKQKEKVLSQVNETIKYHDKVEDLMGKAKKASKKPNGSGYYVSFIMVLTDPTNVQVKQNGNVRVSNNYSIIKTDIPKISDDYLIN